MTSLSRGYCWGGFTHFPHRLSTPSQRALSLAFSVRVWDGDALSCRLHVLGLFSALAALKLGAESSGICRGWAGVALSSIDMALKNNLRNGLERIRPRRDIMFSILMLSECFESDAWPVYHKATPERFRRVIFISALRASIASHDSAFRRVIS